MYDRQQILMIRWRESMEAVVPLEIKGLKANMMQLRGIVSSLNSNTASAIEKGTALQAQVADLQNELTQHISDLEFAAGALGNSPPSSNGQSTALDDQPKPVLSSPVVEPAAPTFQPTS
jgi:hypothetical protein